MRVTDSHPRRLGGRGSTPRDSMSTLGWDAATRSVVSNSLTHRYTERALCRDHNTSCPGLSPLVFGAAPSML